MLSKNTEFYLIASDVEKCRAWLEDLSKDGVRELWEARTRDMYEGEGYRKEGYCNLH